MVPQVRFSFQGPHEKQQLHPGAAQALEILFKDAEEAGHLLYALSGYRSYQRQQAIYSSYIQQLGEAAANKISAPPGHSEHQTGLAMDITSEGVNFTLSEDFGSTPEGLWIAKNAHRYGFIIRYQKGMEGITGYSYEPWHLRYVGVEAATAVYEQGITLEDYLMN